VVGIIEADAALARRRSRWGASCRFWSPVILCTVVIKPSVIPQLSSMTLTKGATLFVVQEAHDRTGARRSLGVSFTPKTIVGISRSAEGAEIITCRAPDCRCVWARCAAVNL